MQEDTSFFPHMGISLKNDVNVLMRIKRESLKKLDLHNTPFESNLLNPKEISDLILQKPAITNKGKHIPFVLLKDTRIIKKVVIPFRC